MKRLLSMLCAAAVLATLAACGSGNGDNGLSPDSIGDTIGAAVLEAGSSHVDATLRAPGQEAGFEADEAFDGPALEDISADITLSGDVYDGTSSRLVGGWLYKSNNFREAPDFLQHWLKIDPHDAASSELGAFPDYVGPAQLSMLFQSASDVRDRGEGSVDGIPAHRYQVALPAETAMSGLGLTGDELRGRGVADPVQVTVWLDADHRPVVLELDAGASMYVKVHYSKWGEVVHVQAPAQSDVYDMTG